MVEMTLDVKFLGFVLVGPDGIQIATEDAESAVGVTEQMRAMSLGYVK